MGKQRDIFKSLIYILHNVFDIKSKVKDFYESNACKYMWIDVTGFKNLYIPSHAHAK